MSSPNPKNILIVRTDRVGDVMLTTPLSSALRRQFPQAKISWLVRPYAAPLLTGNPDIDEILLDQGQSTAELTELFKARAFDLAIVAYPRWRTVSALWRAKIPRRIGPASKWYALFFTDRIWQHRSEGAKHESDYNLELLKPLGIPFERHPTRLVLTPEEVETARRKLAGYRIGSEKPLAILHPGSGGSSPRWPLTSFMELGDRLMEAGYSVLVTAGPGEAYQYKMLDGMRRQPALLPGGSVNLREFAAILSLGQVIVTNSTGPLHIAVALDVPTVSIYAPIATCHPTRWGPYPAYAEGNKLHEVFIAPMAGEKVNMGAVSIDEVWRASEAKLRRSAAEKRAF